MRISAQEISKILLRELKIEIPPCWLNMCYTKRYPHWNILTSPYTENVGYSQQWWCPHLIFIFDVGPRQRRRFVIAPTAVLSSISHPTSYAHSRPTLMFSPQHPTPIFHCHHQRGQHFLLHLLLCLWPLSKASCETSRTLPTKIKTSSRSALQSALLDPMHLPHLWHHDHPPCNCLSLSLPFLFSPLS